MTMKLMDILSEISPKDQAKKLGYSYKGFGYWTKGGKTVAKTVGNKLIPVGGKSLPNKKIKAKPLTKKKAAVKKNTKTIDINNIPFKKLKSYGDHFSLTLGQKNKYEEWEKKSSRYQTETFRRNLKPEIRKKLSELNDRWQNDGNYSGRADVKKRRNEFLNKVMNNPKNPAVIKTKKPIYRGMRLEGNTLKKFMQSIPNVGGIFTMPPSGFSANASTAYLFSKPDKNKHGVFMRIFPNKKGKIFGLHLNNKEIKEKKTPQDIKIQKSLFDLWDSIHYANKSKHQSEFNFLYLQWIFKHGKLTNQQKERITSDFNEISDIVEDIVYFKIDPYFDPQKTADFLKRHGIINNHTGSPYTSDQLTGYWEQDDIVELVTEPFMKKYSSLIRKSLGMKKSKFPSRTLKSLIYDFANEKNMQFTSKHDYEENENYNEYGEEQEIIHSGKVQLRVKKIWAEQSKEVLRHGFFGGKVGGNVYYIDFETIGVPGIKESNEFDKEINTSVRGDEENVFKKEMNTSISDLDPDAPHHKAHKLGLDYSGFGYWKKNGETVARTVDGRLVPMKKESDNHDEKTPDVRKMLLKHANKQLMSHIQKMKQSMNNLKKGLTAAKAGQIDKNELKPLWKEFIQNRKTVQKAREKINVIKGSNK